MPVCAVLSAVLVKSASRAIFSRAKTSPQPTRIEIIRPAVAGYDFVPMRWLMSWAYGMISSDWIQT
jgi:hypothetical protein